MSNCHSCQGCSLDHNSSHDLKIKKKDLVLLVLSVMTFIFSIFIENEAYSTILSIISLISAGYNIFVNAIKSIINLKIQENVLLFTAVIAATFLGELLEACVVTILFKIGNYLEDIAVSRSIKNINKLIEIRADTANILDENDNIKTVMAKDVKIGEKIIIRPGEKIPLDSKILKGASDIDTSAITGESLPIHVQTEDTVLSGSVNISGIIVCEAIKDFESSTASQIIDLVYKSTSKKSKTEKFITKFSKIYTPIVILAAFFIAIIPPMFGLLDFNTAILRSLVFLVASCPCALVISIPLTFFCSVGACSKIGILVKGSKYIENIAKTNCIAFDKTGTITSGEIKIEKIEFLGDYTEQQIKNILVSIEMNSIHPIAKALINHIKDYTKLNLENVQEIAGSGIKCVYENKEILCGNYNMMISNNINVDNVQKDANIYISVENKLQAIVFTKEEIFDETLKAIHILKNKLHKNLVILSGDNDRAVKKVAEICKIDTFYSKLLPNEKVDKIEQIKSNGYNTIFVGDGINDAPIIAASDIGASMGLGSEIANSTSDIVIINNKLISLVKLFPLAKRTINIAKFNIWFSLVTKALILILGVFGATGLWVAVFADIGISILSILNAVRILKIKDNTA